MKVIKGKYNEAIVYTDIIEESAIDQIRLICDQKFLRESKIRVMPDVHVGVGATIGTTMTINKTIVPNLVGVDIGCGMETIQIKNKHIELQKLDKLIYERIPAGFNIRTKEHSYTSKINIENLKCLKKGKINFSRAKLSLGTLGGGNHFIEVNKGNNKSLYVTIHSGSRHLGLEVANYYQELAYKELNENGHKHLAYLQGELMNDYIHDMKIVQQYALINRKAMMNEIIKGMKLKVVDEFSTIHNYLDTDCMILRKGAVSAQKNEKIIIPINMRDGSLICIGKGNVNWNYSAPHGAGRVLSRRDTKDNFTLSEFKKQMKGIYTTSIDMSTLDECPMVYKNIDDILKNIDDTVEVDEIIKPIYNFKAKNIK